MRTFKFYKNELGWFIHLKYFPFNVAYCAMVAGADDLIESLANGKKEIYLQISTRKIKGYTEVIRKVKGLGLGSGAVYSPENTVLKTDIFDGQNLLWLCPVTLFVFFRYPNKIYIKKAKTPDNVSKVSKSE